MLVTLLAWILITLVCWAWGMLVLQRLQRWLKDDPFAHPSFSIVCITGFAFVTVIAGILSLWLPLGHWLVHLAVVIPCLSLFFQRNRVSFLAELKRQFAGLHPAVLFLFAISLVMVLVMSTWTINHPDTLAYHAQTIHWIEEYKAVPGLVHLYSRYGAQGQWFVSSAFFSFRFTGIEALTFINSTFLLWYLLFVMQKIDRYLSVPGQRMNAVLWLLLFIASCLSYTQVRLTASSASPDFIATLLVWTAFYLFIQKQASSSLLQWLLVIIVCVFSVTIKLSAIPVLLIAVYAFIKLLQLKNIKAITVSILLAILILFPFVSRNIITTGYLVFPSAFPDIVNVDWKFNKAHTLLEKKYITAYARTQVEYSKESIEAVVAMSPGNWLPVWWRNISTADKAILLLLALSFAVLVVRSGILRRLSMENQVALATATAGIIFWFVQAPDPRFGFGFILSFVAIVWALFFTRLGAINRIPQKAILGLVLASAVTVSAYTVYRYVHFFSLKQLVRPMGIEKKPATSFRCQNILFYKPGDDELCGDMPLPCIYSDSCNFILRGNTIGQGFRAKSTGHK